MRLRVWVTRSFYDRLRGQADTRNRSLQAQALHCLEIGAGVSDRTAEFERHVAEAVARMSADVAPPALPQR